MRENYKEYAKNKIDECIETARKKLNGLFERIKGFG